MAEPNIKKMSLREGKAFRDGNEITSLISLEVAVAMEVSSKKVVGQRGTSHKALGYNVTGTITKYKNNKFIRELFDEYTETGIFPQFDIQASQTDPDSDFVSNYGADRVQIIGIQLTGDLPILSLDAEGEEVTEEITFEASEIR